MARWTPSGAAKAAVGRCGRQGPRSLRHTDGPDAPAALDRRLHRLDELYFESSATTPFHFLNQSVLSEGRASAARSAVSGLRHRTRCRPTPDPRCRYYLALTDEAISAATDHPDSPRSNCRRGSCSRSPTRRSSRRARQPAVVQRPWRPSVSSPASGTPAGSARPSRLQRAGARHPAARRGQPRAWQRVVTLADADAVELPPSPSAMSSSTPTTSRSGRRAGCPRARQDLVLPELVGRRRRGSVADRAEHDGRLPTSSDVEIRYGYTPVEYGSCPHPAGPAGGRPGPTAVAGRRRRCAGPAPMSGIDAVAADTTTATAPVWADESHRPNRRRSRSPSGWPTPTRRTALAADAVDPMPVPAHDLDSPTPSPPTPTRRPTTGPTTGHERAGMRSGSGCS